MKYPEQDIRNMKIIKDAIIIGLLHFFEFALHYIF